MSLLLGRNPGPIARGRGLLDLDDARGAGGTAVRYPRPAARRRRGRAVAHRGERTRERSARAATSRRFRSPACSASRASTSNDLFEQRLGYLELLGTVTGPIFQGGATVGVNEQADAQRRSSSPSTSRTVQRAFADVDDALVATQKSAERNDAQRAAGRGAARLRAAVAQALRRRLLELPRGARRRDVALQRGTALQPGSARSACSPTSICTRRSAAAG